MAFQNEDIMLTLTGKLDGDLDTDDLEDCLQTVRDAVDELRRYFVIEGSVDINGKIPL